MQQETELRAALVGFHASHSYLVQKNRARVALINLELSTGGTDASGAGAGTGTGAGAAVKKHAVDDDTWMSVRRYRKCNMAVAAALNDISAAAARVCSGTDWSARQIQALCAAVTQSLTYERQEVWHECVLFMQSGSTDRARTVDAMSESAVAPAGAGAGAGAGAVTASSAGDSSRQLSDFVAATVCPKPTAPLFQQVLK